MRYDKFIKLWSAIALKCALEWLYVVRYNKFIKLCSAMSGLPSQRKIVCAVVALRSSILEWLYWQRGAKLCAVHNAWSGLRNNTKNLCAVAAYWQRKGIVIITTIEYHSALLLLFACRCLSLHAAVCNRHCSLVVAHHRVKVMLPLAVADKDGTIDHHH